jgi:hypothetical protein
VDNLAWWLFWALNPSYRLAAAAQFPASDYPLRIIRIE